MNTYLITNGCFYDLEIVSVVQREKAANMQELWRKFLLERPATPARWSLDLGVSYREWCKDARRHLKELKRWCKMLGCGRGASRDPRKQYLKWLIDRHGFSVVKYQEAEMDVDVSTYF